MEALESITWIEPEHAREARRRLIDEATAVGLAETFQALADPTRVRLISALMDGELCVLDLAAALGMSQSATSHQLRLLRTASCQISQGWSYCLLLLDDDHIRDLFQRGLEHYSHNP